MGDYQVVQIKAPRFKLALHGAQYTGENTVNIDYKQYVFFIKQNGQISERK
jgi:hypothetical protein